MSHDDPEQYYKYGLKKRKNTDRKSTVSAYLRMSEIDFLVDLNPEGDVSKAISQCIRIVMASKASAAAAIKAAAEARDQDAVKTGSAFDD